MIVAERDKRLFRHITNRNLLWQYDFLMDSIRIGLPKRHKLDDYIISSLNFFAVANLSETPGMVRNDDVYIQASDHDPPGYQDVKGVYLDFIVDLHKQWTLLDPFQVAALVLWRINWIHPFIEGNGRTARAAMYYALSIKLGKMLPGAVPITAQLRRRPSLYYKHLADIDKTYKKTGLADLDALAAYLKALYERQLDS
jgi:Fic family protein